MDDRRGTPSIAQVSLIGLFVAALVTAQLTASKVLAFDLPVAIPVAGAELVLPVRRWPTRSPFSRATVTPNCTGAARPRSWSMSRSR